jgi:hypothetical protein
MPELGNFGLPLTISYVTYVGFQEREKGWMVLGQLSSFLQKAT